MVEIMRVADIQGHSLERSISRVIDVCVPKRKPPVIVVPFGPEVLIDCGRNTSAYFSLIKQKYNGIEKKGEEKEEKKAGQERGKQRGTRKRRGKEKKRGKRKRKRERNGMKGGRVNTMTQDCE